MVLGKFIPPHLGHVYLIDFARNYVDELVIVVETQQTQPIPGELRYNWVRQMFPDANVLQMTDENPQGTRRASGLLAGLEAKLEKDPAVLTRLPFCFRRLRVEVSGSNGRDIYPR